MATPLLRAFQWFPMAPHHHQNTVPGERGANNEGQAINLPGSSSAGYRPDFGTGRNFFKQD